MPKKMIKEEFIAKARQVHGDRYDYSKVDYKNKNTKVCIICPEHGEFWQIPYDHIVGRGCAKCAGCYKPTTHEFISKARKVHGDKYDYSKVDYKNSATKVCIICPEHGEFWMSPHDHLRGHSCARCSGHGKKSIQDFIYAAKVKHSNKYDYSKVAYKGMRHKVCIVCLKHGEFWQVPSQHLRGDGCPSCGGVAKLNTEKFIEKAKQVHNNKYDYSKVEYKTGHTKVCIICPEHGEFWQAPVFHNQGSGCPICAGVEKFTKEEFISKARKVHGDKYDYSKVDYKNSATKVCIICPEHGEFWQQASIHINGSGCPVCGHGFIASYVLKLLDETDIPALDPHQLMEIINMGKLPKQFKELVYSFASTDARQDSLKKLKEIYEAKVSTQDDEDTDVDIQDDESVLLRKDDMEDEQSDATMPPTDPQPVTEEQRQEIIDDAQATAAEAEHEFVNQIQQFDYLNIEPSEEGGQFLVEYMINKGWRALFSDKDNFMAKYKADPSSGPFFDAVRDAFLQEYDKVLALHPDESCIFPHEPNLMQKLIVYRVLTHDEYGNWCGTGAGKSFSRDWAAHAIDARVSVYMVPNSVIPTTIEAIKEAYNDVDITTPEKPADIKLLDRDKHNVIIVNYDKFSTEHTDKWIQALLQNQIDFICLDEIQNVKVRSERDRSKRNTVTVKFIRQAKSANEDMKLLVMSATPLINNLTEVRELMGLLTGKVYSDIGNDINLTNIHNAYKALTLNGFRYTPTYNIKIEDTYPQIDGSELKDILVQMNDKDVLGTEQALLDKKLDWCISQGKIRNGTIVYTQFVDGMADRIKTRLHHAGFKVGCYTGEVDMQERDRIKRRFQSGSLDVLVGSQPMLEGINGFQYVCDNLIVLSLPWTHSAWQQLIGRVYRQGSAFSTVSVIVPQVNVGPWSWDKRRRGIIEHKRTLGESVMDGVFPFDKGYASPYMQKQLHKKAMEALRQGLEQNSVERKSYKA